MNKPRLIDANKLIMSIADWQQSLSTPDVDMVDKVIWDTLESAIMTIEDQPTAYDIDKVVEQLEDLADKEEARYRTVYGDERIRIDGFVDGLQHAIEIVKGGAE